ncbi:conserved hypothetical protein [Ricinus communis]|uniref:Uncharacterized protein n=1 Tax=Ricinus communis TaxID=3988 RepID=B9RHL5_RICCO|nr:conserved hypothetical protein [Ricinus communis]
MCEKYLSPSGIILVPTPIKKKRGKMPKARRKEVEEVQQKGKKKNKVKRKLTRKGVISIKCSVSSKMEHNKRYHESFAPHASTSSANSDARSGPISINMKEGPSFANREEGSSM